MEVHFCFENSTDQAQLSVMQVPGADISKYGVIAQGHTLGSVAGIVEKFSFDEAPSDTDSIGRYILTQDIFDVLRDLPAGHGAQIQLTDAINIQAQRLTLNAVHLTCAASSLQFCAESLGLNLWR